MASPIISCATELLLAMYSAERRLFSSSTRLMASDYQNEFATPSSYRYTTVSLLGLQRAFGILGESARFAPLLDAFATRHWRQISSVGDLGVLCSLLDSIEHPLRDPVFATIEKMCAGPEFIARTSAQEICQLLIALCEMHTRRVRPACEALARRTWSVVHSHFVCDKTSFCFQNPKWLRRTFVSFGAMSYYLRALHDFARAFQDEVASRLWEAGLKRIVALQGPRGEWPWFLNTLRGQVAEWYEIYSVHQHAMAFLFLFPALAEGHEDLAGSIRRSYEWVLGNNQLGKPMLQIKPFFIYRSIRRREGQARLRRFARAGACAWRGQPASLAPASSLEVNTECRSYEMGWLLYVWCEQHRFQDFQSLKWMPVEREADVVSLAGKG